MKLNRKLINIALLSTMALAIIGLILGSFYDQQLTKHVGDNYNLFGILLTGFGAIVSPLLACFAAAALFFAPQLQNKKLDIGMRILGAAAFIILNVFAIKEAVEYVNFPRMEADATTYKVLMIVFVVLVDLGIIMVTKLKVKKLDQSILIPTCLVIIIILAGYAASTEVVKYLVSRPRPRVVASTGEAFRNWYEFRPFELLKDGHHDCKSFVSGHASNATCTITLIPLIISLTSLNEKKNSQLLGIIIGVLYTFVVAFSRIIATAHYLSDVMGGIILSSAVALVVVNVAFKILKKE